MNEPASFVNGAVPPGCKDATLNRPPYMPCKDPGSLCLQNCGHRKQPLQEPQGQGFVLTSQGPSSVVLWVLGGRQRQTHFKHFTHSGVCKSLAP